MAKIPNVTEIPNRPKVARPLGLASDQYTRHASKAEEAASYTGGDIAEPASSAPPEPMTYVNKELASAPGVLKQPDRITIFPGLALSCSVYIVTSATGAGKSVTTAALCGLANANKVPATYLYHFEPGSEPVLTGAGLNLSEVFCDAKSYLTDLETHLRLVKRAAPPAQPRGLLALDSITDPLKAYSFEYAGQGTFEGGMQISDRIFLDRLSYLASRANIAILAVINSSLIPYADKLYGATWGRITVLNARTIVVEDRSEASGRAAKQVQLPESAVRATLAAFKYPLTSGGNYVFGRQTLHGGELPSPQNSRLVDRS